MHLINKIAKTLIFTELTLIVLPFLVELITEFKAVNFLANVFGYITVTFFIIWSLVLLASIIYKIKSGKNSESIQTAVLLSLAGLFGPIILIYIVVAGLH
jgi:hypothetical protein